MQPSSSLKPRWYLRQRFWIYCACCVFVVVLAMSFDYKDGVRWQGGYTVPVRIERRSQSPIKKISVTAFWRREWELVKGELESVDSVWKPLVSADGKSEINVRTGGSDNVFGGKVSYHRQEVVVLKVEYEKGTVTYVKADIPDARSREPLVIEVP